MISEGYHHENLSAALLESARQELEEKGIRDFSLRSVAVRSGVSHGAPYRHFRGKPGLIAALVALGFKELTSALMEAEAASGGGSFEKLNAQGSAYLDFGRRNPALLELIFSKPGFDALRSVGGVSKNGLAGPPLPPEEYDAFGVLERRVAACAAEGSLDDGIPVRDLATLVWSVVHGIATLNREGVLADMASHRGMTPLEQERALLEAFRRIYGYRSAP